ncbi:D-amino acid aminotransferase [Thalassotalea euphylliae]|uniref:D-amino acid aminotransferase n=1 Tax=Thalassotalea euphylliae TaxID=1655234 RepID=UPI003633B8B5
MADTVFLNGDFIAKDSAKVSVLDRGFLFGDAIYEVIPVYASSLFRLDQHLDRLEYCLAQIKLHNPFSRAEWQSLMQQIIDKNGGGHLSIYLQVTRGADPERNHVSEHSTQPTVLIMPMPLSTSVAELSPIKVALIEDFRWQHCDIKTTSLLGNILLRNQAAQAGFDEAILCRDNIITEASSSNVFMVKQGVIYTPPKSHHILAGITRDLIVELAENASIKVTQKEFTAQDLLSADEVWLSSSSREISPVVTIDDKMVNQGGIGPVSKAIHQHFQQFKNSLLSA